MGSMDCGVEIANDNSNNNKNKKKKRAVWVYPKVMGANPSERWGHSACYSNGLLYVFGGCRGGVHFSDVLVLNLETMTWNILVTTGQGPGPRDSHGAVVVGTKMLVFGGTNGSTKVNDLHMLDLRTLDWSRPKFQGVPPSPRESHTATLIGDDRVVVFGGSGQGEANYLNDLHVLDLNTMTWTSPDVRGCLPAPRDSHSAVVMENNLFVYGGDCGDRYYGDVDVLDFDTWTWSRLDVLGPSPSVRAGHASVNLGSKMYVIGGVGEKQYYNDVWVLDVMTRTWSEIEVCGQIPRGRFSHTAIIAHNDIAIYGGCGADEKPLNELLILQLGMENPNVTFKNFLDYESKLPTLHPKRRRTYEIDLEAENDHSLSLSQRSSSSQSNQELGSVNLGPVSTTHSETYPLRKQSFSPSNSQTNLIQRIETNHKNIIPITAKDLRLFGGDQHSHTPHYKPPLETGQYQNLIGAEIHGKVDGAFDSGYLMTAMVNGKVFRGVLFAPGPDLASRGSILCQNPSQPPNQISVNHTNNVKNASQSYKRPHHHHQPGQGTNQEIFQRFRTVPGRRLSTHVKSPTLAKDPSQSQSHSHRNDMHGVVLSLGGPGFSHAK